MIDLDKRKGLVCALKHDMLFPSFLASYHQHLSELHKSIFQIHIDTNICSNYNRTTVYKTVCIQVQIFLKALCTTVPSEYTFQTSNQSFRRGNPMILSHMEIEHIALAVTQDFTKYISHDSSETKRRIPRAIPIDQFAHDYLGLNIGFARLSPDESVCGLTCYADTEDTFEENGVVRTLPISQNQILLDVSFQMPGRKKELHGKRRFTLAHECAHQLLFQMESDDVKQRHRGKYSPRTAYSLRALKTREDWNEWQANALGAAILMPQMEIELAMQLFPAKKF